MDDQERRNAENAPEGDDDVEAHLKKELAAGLAGAAIFAGGANAAVQPGDGSAGASAFGQPAAAEPAPGGGGSVSAHPVLPEPGMPGAAPVLPEPGMPGAAPILPDPGNAGQMKPTKPEPAPGSESTGVVQDQKQKAKPVAKKKPGKLQQAKKKLTQIGKFKPPLQP